jgi:hypothetical protein
MTNTRPTYYAVPYRIPPNLGNPKLVPGRFAVYEVRDSEASFMFHMSNRGDRLNEILKRGIPLEDAKTLFYQMDG